LRILQLLADATGDKGLKPTATGNLPRNVSREIARQYLGADVYANRTQFGDFQSEQDVAELHAVRLVAGLAGLVRKYRGRFVVSKACREMVRKEDWPALYEKLFEQYIRRFNWAYPRGLMEVGFFQQSFAFSLYLLSRFGDQPRPASFYADRFVQAFPMLLDMEPPTQAWKPADALKFAYTSQVLRSFADLFGLVKYERWPYGSSRPNTVTALALLGRVADFHIAQ
jgi:hypothetical protein